MIQLFINVILTWVITKSERQVYAVSWWVQNGFQNLLSWLEFILISLGLEISQISTAPAGLGSSDFLNYFVSAVSIHGCLRDKTYGHLTFWRERPIYCEMSQSDPEQIQVVQQQTTILGEKVPMSSLKGYCYNRGFIFSADGFVWLRFRVLWTSCGK